MADSEDVKAKAAEQKELGTTAYKAKDFETAIRHYTAAAEIDPTDMVFHLNVAAVYMQQKMYDECIAAAIKASEVGMDNRADYKQQAKAAARVGKAYYAKGDLENALKYYDKALTNDRNKEYLTMKKKVQADIKEAKRKAYINPELATEAKAKGTAALKAGDFPTAIKEYTEAIERNPDDVAFTSRVYSNRAMCYTKLMELPHALKDSEMVIKLDPAWVKGYLRKANCLVGMRKHQEAIDVYNEALAVDPSNQEAQAGIRGAAQAKMGATAGMTQEQRAQEAMKDPEIQGIMRDPAMQAVLQQMQEDPSSIQSHFSNPVIAAKLKKLIDGGILQTR